MSVLLTPVSGNKAQIIIKNLAKYKIKIITCDHEHISPGFFSKHSSKHYITPSPVLNPVEYVHTLISIIQRENIDVLLPVHSTETLVISKYKEELEKYCHVPCSDYNTMLQLHDKAKLYDLAVKLGLPVPLTFSANSYDEYTALKKKLKYPVVLKPKTESGSKGVKYANSEAQLDRYVNPIFRESFNNFPLIQEYIKGDGYGVSSIYDYGKLIAYITHKRLREYPLTGGPSTLRISTEHHEMEMIAMRLLTNVNWHGVAMVEFKLDKISGKPYIIEVNPRFWGSINQAISSGIDFPYLLYQLEFQNEKNKDYTYKKGVKTQFLTNDIRALCSEIIHTRDPNYIFKWINEMKTIDAIDEDFFGDPFFYMVFLIKEIKKLIIP
ncbi:MAG: ATP-grasp domain-containing protein [Candidatus Eremiobacterota bacterium]